jgi:hypothetical protein
MKNHYRLKTGLLRGLWGVLCAVVLISIPGVIPGAEAAAKPRAAAHRAPAAVSGQDAGPTAGESRLPRLPHLPTGGDIPDALKPWQAWVLRGQEAWLCPEVDGEHENNFCAWPGELELAAQDKGVRFTQSWEVQQKSAVRLPGERKFWPQQVTVDGRAQPVLVDANGGGPLLWLPAGKHVVSGWIPWAERPQTLSVPLNVALISLSIDGKPVLALERNETSLSSSLTLGRAGAQAGEQVREEDSAEFQVYRKLSDGLPARLTTRVQFKVSGKARELTLPDILPKGFVPVSLVSPWTARLEQDGRLQVQALPGQATLVIEARLDEPLHKLAPRLSRAWEQEVWSYAAAPALRTTAILPASEDGSVLAVDPRQAHVPADWLLLPAFVVREGAQFQIEERSRGQNERENQRLTLRREMWLDFSGAGFFARDRIEGSMRQGWRFDVAQPYTLERADSLAAQANGANWGGRQLASNALGGAQGAMAALLVTHNIADEKLTGVEWRQPQVTLNAGVRLAAGASARIPVTGWQQSFDSVETRLHLPYGYRLLAAAGADSTSSNVWVERWTILNIFLAAFFTLLAWRLLGRAGGIATAFWLLLAMPEPFAPVYSFATVVILALLRQAMPTGRLRNLFQAGERLALLVLVVVAVIFIPAQIRYALYPQLESDRGFQIPIPGPMAPAPEQMEGQLAEWEAEDQVLPSPAAEPVPPPAPAPAQAKMALRRAQPDSAVVAAKSLSSSSFRQRYAQSTVTQTGGGEPDWALGQQYRLQWSGPVAETQRVRFLISPPWLTWLWRVAMIVLLGRLIWRLIRLSFPTGFSSGGTRLPWLRAGAPGGTPAEAVPPGSSAPASSTLASLGGVCLAALLVGALGWPSSAAAAEVGGGGGAFPPPELLEELKTRLLEAPDCAPRCVDLAEARVEAGAGALRVLLVAHVEVASSLPLPEPGDHLTLRAVRVDGEVRAVLRVDGKNYVALARGVHHVQLEYTPGDDTAVLSFPLVPARIEFAGSGWHVEGIDENRLLSETLNFSRVPSDVAPASAGEGGQPERAAQQFPPFVHVQRDIELDLDWSINTRVTRVAPSGGGFTFSVPLLPGEHVTTPDVKVQDGSALAVFTTHDSNTGWTARLDKAQTLELVAPPLSERAETWRVSVSPSWHLEWNGVPVTLSGDGEQVVFEFHPLPGEKLVLTLTPPVKTEGSIRAIDRVGLESRIGQHASDHALTFTLRASQGGEHRITLPVGLEVLDVQRDNVHLNLQPQENQLSLPVSPGAQTFALKLREQRDVGWVTSSPVINLGLPAANINLHTTLTEQRWILATRGPAVGPAVLYWGELLVALILAFLLARSGKTSLQRWQWFLLVFGFSTFSWATLLVITLWLLVVDWRIRTESFIDWSARKFNAMQAGIVALTAWMLIQLIGAVSEGLLSVPGMGIRGYGSGGNQLNWFADQSTASLPITKVFSLPVWFYRLVMLAWALWLAYILIRWLSRGLGAWLRQGYWRKSEHMRQAGDEKPGKV